MLAGVLVQVDQLGGGLDGAEGSLLHRESRACKGDHGPVVIQVGGAVQDTRTFDGLNGGDDLVDHLGAPRFGKIGDAFD